MVQRLKYSIYIQTGIEPVHIVFHEIRNTTLELQVAIPSNAFL